MVLHDSLLPLVAEPNLKEAFQFPLEAKHGKWNPSKKGVVSVVNLPEDNHIPVLFHSVPLDEAFIELEFQLEEQGSVIIIGCDGNKPNNPIKHIGRVEASASGLVITEDSNEKSTMVSKLPMELKLGRWYHLKASWKGDQFAGSIDKKELKAQHPYFVANRVQSWLAASDKVQIRNLKIYGKASDAVQQVK